MRCRSFVVPDLFRHPFPGKGCDPKFGAAAAARWTPEHVRGDEEIGAAQ